MTSPSPVFLLTDFGTRDPYVGLMKAVLMENTPAPRIVDLTHEVSPQNEVNAAFLLEYCLPDLPPESIVLLVVDPKVGTDRDIIALQTQESKKIVAPDTGMVNGLHWEKAHYVRNRELARTQISSTFHGRDWFAPVGRYLSQGGTLENLGPAVEELSGEELIPEPSTTEEGLRGEVAHVDHFGNLITNIPGSLVSDVREDGNYLKIFLNDKTIEGIVSTYEESDGLTGVIGSFGTLEVSLPGGSAAEDLDGEIGSPVSVKPAGADQDA